MEFTFGKYKGRAVGDIIRTDPLYAQWVAMNLHSTQSEVVEYIRANMDCDVTYIDFGVHKGASIAQLKESYPKYVQFLRDSTWVKEHRPNLLSELF